MRRVVHRIQNLGQRAGQLKEAAIAMPERAAEIRDAVLLTTGQLQQLRADVEASLVGLRADGDDRITQALRELNESAAIFREAGYELDGVDLEISPVQRLIVSLDKVANVGATRLRALRQASADKATVRAVLEAMIKADETAARVRMSGLDFSELIVHVGPAPSVRLCWRAPVDVAPIAAQPDAPALSAIVPPARPVTGLLGEGSFFGHRVLAPTAGSDVAKALDPAQTPSDGLPAQTASRATQTTTSTTAKRDADSLRSPLDRFKKMPDLGRRS